MRACDIELDFWERERAIGFRKANPKFRGEDTYLADQILERLYNSPDTLQANESLTCLLSLWENKDEDYLNWIKSKYKAVIGCIQHRAEHISKKRVKYENSISLHTSL